MKSFKFVCNLKCSKSNTFYIHKGPVEFFLDSHYAISISTVSKKCYSARNIVVMHSTEK